MQVKDMVAIAMLIVAIPLLANLGDKPATKKEIEQNIATLSREIISNPTGIAGDEGITKPKETVSIQEPTTWDKYYADETGSKKTRAILHNYYTDLKGGE